jgi:hypothetical protein
VSDSEFRIQYESHRQRHVGNYTICMLLRMALGVVSLGTLVLAYIETVAIYGQRSQERPLESFGLFGTSLTTLLVFCGLGLLWAALSVLVYFREALFPVELNCPKCAVRVDEIGLIDGHCPKCQVQLR